MIKPSDGRLSGRDRARLRAAHESGYLNARCASYQLLIQAFSLWCWRLRIPMVWLEFRTPHSRYGHVRLDMFTTVNRLTMQGQAEMQALAAARASPHDACWHRVPLRDLDRVASAVLRAATRAGNCEPNRSKLVADVRRRMPERLAVVA